MSDARYEQDFYRWTAEQAKLLRDSAGHGVNAPLDWLNLAEEIESLGRSDRRELSSRLETILEHLLKLEFSPASEPRQGWQATVRRERRAIQRLLKHSPSLAPDISELLDDERQAAEFEAAAAMATYGELAEGVTALLAGRRYTPDQVLGDWLPAGHGRES